MPPTHCYTATTPPCTVAPALGAFARQVPGASYGTWLGAGRDKTHARAADYMERDGRRVRKVCARQPSRRAFHRHPNPRLAVPVAGIPRSLYIACLFYFLQAEHLRAVTQIKSSA